MLSISFAEIEMDFFVIVVVGDDVIFRLFVNVCSHRERPNFILDRYFKAYKLHFFSPHQLYCF